MQSPVALTAAIETGLNRYLELDPATLEALESLNEKVIELKLEGLDLSLYLLPGRTVTVLGQYDGEADACIAGTPMSLLRMTASSQAEKSLFSGEVTMSGDSDVGQRFKRILDTMDIDWEEHLSRVTGDIVAHQLMRRATRFADWGRQALGSLGLSTADWLQEESLQVASNDDVFHFVSDVDTLRSDLSRLEARIRRLADKIQ